MMRLLRPRAAGVRALVTRRLRLEVMTPALLNAEGHDDWQLGEGMRAHLSPDWPPQLWDSPVRAHIVALLTSQPETAGWHRYLVLVAQGGEPAKDLLVGCIGAFPAAPGDVELGYSVVTSRQRQGLATEAVQALSEWLLRQPSIHSVSAQAYTASPASVRVMERSGMRYLGAGDEADTVKYRRWR